MNLLCLAFNPRTCGLSYVLALVFGFGDRLRDAESSGKPRGTCDTDDASGGTYRGLYNENILWVVAILEAFFAFLSIHIPFI